MPKTFDRSKVRLALALTGALTGLVAVPACTSTSTYNNPSALPERGAKADTGYYGSRIPAPIHSSAAIGGNSAVPGNTTGKPGRKLYLGKASYICTPSGFGQKSRCVSRSAKT